MFAHGNHGVSRSPGLQGVSSTFTHLFPPMFSFQLGTFYFSSPVSRARPPRHLLHPPEVPVLPWRRLFHPPITRPSVSSISTSATLTSYSRLLALHLFPVLVEQYKSIEIHNTGQNVQHFPCQSVEVVRTKTSNNAMQWEHFSDRGFPRSVASEVRVWYK